MPNDLPWPILPLIAARQAGQQSGPTPPAAPTFPVTELGLIVEAYLGADPTADPNTWPDPVDLSGRLIRTSIGITRGRRPGQRSLSAGSCTFWLENTDGALTPLLATSEFYPDWDLGVPMRISADNVGDVGMVAPHVRFAGFAADITMVMVPGTAGVNVSAVRVTLGGTWRRISQGSVVKSPLLRSNLSRGAAVPIAYWPCEDSDGAAYIASGLPGGIPMTGATPVFASSNIPGSAGALDMSSGPGVLGLSAVVALPSSSGFQLEYSAYTEVTTDPSELLFISSGTLPLTTIAISETLAGSPHHFTVRALQNGANVDFTTYRDGVFSSTTPVPGVLGTSLYIANANPNTAEIVQIAHIVVYGYDDIGVSADRAAAARGNPGEQAHLRILRVSREEGISCSCSAAQSNECGPQPTADVTTVLTDAEGVDHGLLFEDFTFGLGYRASSQRENLAASMTVDLSTYRTTSGTQADVLAPVRNDQRIRNEWTIARPNGNTNVTAIDEAHQAKRGRFNDSATVNVEDDTRILDEATWRLSEGTFDGLRYAQVPLDLGANPGTLLATWITMDLGDRIDRTNHLAEHPTETVRLQIEGYSEVLRPLGWDAQLNAEPYQPWAIGALAGTSGDTNPVLGRLAGDELAAIRAALTSSGTSIAFDPNVYRWTTDADDFPLDVRLGGETVTVSSIATTAATFVAAGSMSSADNAAVTPAIYAGAAADDWILVLARIRAASNGVIDTPLGYTRIRIPGVSASAEMQLFVKVHSGTESAPTITPTGGAAGDTVSAVTFGLRNMPIALDDLNDAVVDASALTNTAAQNVAFPGSLVRRSGAYIDGCVVLLLAGKDDAWTSVAAVVGMTEAVDSATTTGNDQSLAVDYVIQTAATHVSPGSFTVTGGISAVSNGFVVAFAAGFQTMTASARSVNGVVKAQTARTLIEVDDPLILGL
jgi:hypothetical protein